MSAVTKITAGALLCTVFALTGCSGGAGDLVGTWKGHDDDDHEVSIQIFDDGKASINADGSSCQGKVDTDSEPYKLSYDCGVSKGIATLKLAGDGKLQLTEDDETDTLTKTDG